MRQIHHNGGANFMPAPLSIQSEGMLAEVEQVANRLSTMIEHMAAATTRLRTELATSANSSSIIDPCGSTRVVDEILRMRSRRKTIFGEVVTGAAWDILVFAYWAHLHQQRVSIGNVCDGASVPLSTGLRWIDWLRTGGYISVRPDPLDQRRKFVELSPKGTGCLQRYFSESSIAALAA